MNDEWKRIWKKANVVRICLQGLQKNVSG